MKTIFSSPNDTVLKIDFEQCSENRKRSKSEDCIYVSLISETTIDILIQSQMNNKTH